MTADFDRRHILAMAAASGLAAAVLPRPVLAQAAATLPPAPTPQQWAKSPSAQKICLSPSGHHVAYITEEGGQKTLYDFDLVGKQAKTVNIGTAKVNELFWLDDEHIMVTTLVAEKLEVYAGALQTFTLATVFNLAQGKTNLLFERVDHFRGLTYGNVQRITWKGETQVTAASYRLDAEETKYLYRFAPDSDRPWEMDRAPWGTQRWIVTPQGEMIARSVYDRKTSVWLLDYYNAGTWRTIYTQPVSNDWPSLVGLSRDGKSLVVYMPGSDDSKRVGNYYEMTPEGALAKPLVESSFKNYPLFDQATGRLYGFADYTSGWPVYHYDDPKMQAIAAKVQKAFEGYNVVITDRADDPSKLIAYSEGSDDAGTYYYLDFSAGKVLEIAQSYPDIPVEWIASKQAIKYKAADGLEIEAYLTLPPNRDTKNLPLVVHPHGGPQSADDGAFDSEVQSYASRGYAVLQPNFRGSDGYGQAFVEKGYGEWGRKMQTDLSDGVRFLAAQGTIDPKRVCIVGASYGGYAALAGAAFDPGIYNCAVDVAGVADLKSWRDSVLAAENNIKGPRTRYVDQELGTGDWDAVSPARNAAKINIPVLIVHGKEDSVVPYSQSERMASALKAAGKDYQFITFKGQNHWETDEASRIEMMTLIIGFIEKHNPPG